MTLEDLDVEISIMLKLLHLPFKKVSIARDVSSQYVIERFGVVLCAIDRMAYSQVKELTDTKYDGWRSVYVATTDDISKLKEELIWELMKSGYMVWLRENMYQVFKALITSHAFGDKIIVQRLKIWGDAQQYSYLVDRNKDALRVGPSLVLSKEPTFFDYMPE